MRHLKNVMKSNKKRQIIATFIDIATSDTYIQNKAKCNTRQNQAQPWVICFTKKYLPDKCSEPYHKHSSNASQ